MGIGKSNWMKRAHYSAPLTLHLEDIDSPECPLAFDLPVKYFKNIMKLSVGIPGLYIVADDVIIAADTIE